MTGRLAQVRSCRVPFSRTGRRGAAGASEWLTVALKTAACSLPLAAFSPAASGAVESPKGSAALAMRTLKKECLSCHNEEKRKGGLSLASREAVMKGGDEGAALIEGKPEESAMIKLLAPEADPHMPPKKQLGAAHAKVLTEWIRAGAPWDAAALAGESPPREVALAAMPASYRPVLAMALSPDGKTLAAGCGPDLCLLDVSPDGLKLKSRAAAHLDPVQSVAWLPDGRRLVSGAFRRALIWSTEPLAVQREVTGGLTDRISAVTAFPDGGAILLADGTMAEKGVIRVLDVATGHVERTWSAHDDTIFSLALTADGNTLATAGGDKLVKLWKARTGEEIARLEAHGTQATAAAFHPDGTQLVTGGADRRLEVWDVKTKENTIDLVPKGAPFNAVAWSATGPAIFAVDDEGTLLRFADFKPHTGAQSSDTGNKRQLGKASAPLFCLAVNADASLICAGSAEGHVLAWNKDGKLLTDVDLTAAAR